MEKPSETIGETVERFGRDPMRLMDIAREVAGRLGWLSEETIGEIQRTSLRVHEALGLEGMSRTDVIVRDGIPVVLEVNTIPGMTETSLLPQAAAVAGISFPQLLDRIIRSALER